MYTPPNTLTSEIIFKKKKQTSEYPCKVQTVNHVPIGVRQAT